MWQGRYDQLYIGGQWIKPASDGRIEVISPFTEDALGSVPDGTREDMDRAIAAAREAFDHGPWPRMPLAERKAAVARLGAQFRAHEDTLAELVSTEMGCPITMSKGMQSIGARLLIDSYLEIVDDYPFRSFRRSGTGNALVTREPIGVVAAVVPWNAPQLVTMIKIIPALLAGCTVVLKPAPETPFDAYLLAEMAAAAGFPAGVINIVPAGHEIGEYLVTHPSVDKVSFTGSTAAGRRIASLCGQDLRRVSLELGGKSAAIILDDADFDQAVEMLRTASLRNNGQVCSGKTRIVVPERHASELIDRIVALMDSMPIGDPLDPATQIGPLVSKRQRDRVADYLAIGQAEGARIARGGDRPLGLDRGWFIDSTLFVDVDRKMRIAQEEIFGPVLTVLTYKDDKDAIAIANDSAYGLNGAVFSGDFDRALGVASRISSGVVELNGNLVGFHAPIGGWKCSGIGREAGLEAFDAYVECRSIGMSREMVDALEK
ncbi:aldehyde dehydrogenase [Paracoccus versutus]